MTNPDTVEKIGSLVGPNPVPAPSVPELSQVLASAANSDARANQAADRSEEFAAQALAAAGGVSADAAAALSSANAAAASETATALSETNAAASAAAALSSETAAGLSETNAAASAAAALSSENAAGLSETNAAASETASALSETNAAASAAAAAASAASIDVNTLQPKDALLTALAALTTSANKVIYATGPDALSQADFTAHGRALVGGADAAASRSAIGLGTAATKNTGTSAGNVVELDGSSRLPAVDGSQLTGIVSIPTGTILYHAGFSPPAGFLVADGSAISRTTYSDLHAVMCKSSSVTITIASPGVVTWAAHGLSVNDPVVFTTTGALPTGITAGTTYYVQAVVDANQFRISSSAGGSAINTSGSQSGTHTGKSYPFGAGNGTTTFNIPDLRGEFVRGLDRSRGVDSNRVTGSSQTDAFQGHKHTVSALSAGGADASGGTGNGQTTITSSNPVTDGSNGTPRTASETRPRNVALLACIKY